MGSSPRVRKIRYALRWMPDRPYIQLNYLARYHRLANLRNPKTFGEKINWLKLHDHRPEYSRIVDKAEVKEYIREVLGPEYVIPTLGVWDRFADIDFDRLPESFVLKCTHDSEGLVLVPDRAGFDRAAAERKITEALGRNFYYIGREWPYRSVKPRIIAEPYLQDEETGELRDYKFFCFGGEPKMMLVTCGRNRGRMTFDYYDMDFRHLEIRRKYPEAEEPLQRPKTFETMKASARKLSQGCAFMRADFYEVNGKMLFGELTLYPSSGFVPWPEEWEKKMGEWIDLEDHGGHYPDDQRRG